MPSIQEQLQTFDYSKNADMSQLIRDWYRNQNTIYIDREPLTKIFADNDFQLDAETAMNADEKTQQEFAERILSKLVPEKYRVTEEDLQRLQSLNNELGSSTPISGQEHLQEEQKQLLDKVTQQKAILAELPKHLHQGGLPYALETKMVNTLASEDLALNIDKSAKVPQMSRSTHIVTNQEGFDLKEQFIYAGDIVSKWDRDEVLFEYDKRSEQIKQQDVNHTRQPKPMLAGNSLYAVKVTPEAFTPKLEQMKLMVREEKLERKIQPEHFKQETNKTEQKETNAVHVQPVNLKPNKTNLTSFLKEKMIEFKNLFTTAKVQAKKEEQEEHSPPSMKK